MVEIRKNCHEHDVYLDHFCFDCGVGICKYCLTLPKHETHTAVEKKNYNIKNGNFKSKIFGTLVEELRTALKLGDIGVSSLNEQKNNKTLNEELYNEYKENLESKFAIMFEELQKLKQKKCEPASAGADIYQRFELSYVRTNWI